MMMKQYRASFAVLVAVCAAGLVTAQPAVQFVPQGCSGLNVTITLAQAIGSQIEGTVLLTNPQTYSIPITSVKVTLANNIPVAPLTVTADCGDASSVPSSPVAYQLGQLICYFNAELPQGGPASNAAAWTSAKATAVIDLSNAQCSSPITPITQQNTPPPPPPNNVCPAPITLSAGLGVDGDTVYGTVTFSNDGYSNINLASITYDLNPSTVVAPLFGNVQCPSNVVPFNPAVGQAGTLVCRFQVDISNTPNGVSFNTARVKSTLSNTGKACYSPVATIVPLLAG